MIYLLIYFELESYVCRSLTSIKRIRDNTLIQIITCQIVSVVVQKPCQILLQRARYFRIK